MEDKKDNKKDKGHGQNGEEDIETAEAVSANEMTGLISSRPADESEEAAYAELLHYKAGKKTKEDK